MVAQTSAYRPGDWVVYRMTKYSTQPGPRAQNVSASRSGEKYGYTVDKFWIVSEVREDGKLVLQTRRGKQHIVAADDRDLHLANWWERLYYRGRFNAVEQESAA